MSDLNIDKTLLLRQIRKYLGGAEHIPKEYYPLFEAINQSYGHYDGDRELLERAMDISSEELYVSNEQLRQQLEVQNSVLDTLKASLKVLDIDDTKWETQDLVKIAEFLETEISKRKSVEKELQESRKRYRLLVENATDIIYRVNKDGFFTYMNPIAFQLSGYTEEEIYKMRFTDVIREDYRKRVVSYYMNQVKKKTQSTYLEFPLKIKKDTELWVGQNVQLLLEDGKYNGIQAVARDITELMRIRNDLKQAKVEAESSSKAKEAFLANMSHEIRTPMNAIVGMTKLLKNTDTSEEQEKYLDAISTSSRNLIVLINDILDLSKIESGKLELEHLGFSLSDLVDSLYYSQKISADQKGIELHYTIDSAIPKVLIGDPYRLTQILTNLINNAIKFTQQGRVELTVSYIGESDGLHTCRFSVKDTGIGIPADKIEEIFESFSQADTSVTRRFGGTGLGLSITRYLVEMMEGTMHVHSIFGEGTEFTVSVPFQKGTKIEVNVTEDIDTHSLDLKGINVLLVEDNRINRLLIATLFEKWGVNFDWAENGEEAIEFLKENSYDIVLMDMQMPVMGGVEASLIIREELKNQVPIIALTANAYENDVQKCLNAGMNDVLIKPFEPSSLFNKILKQLYQKNKVSN